MVGLVVVCHSRPLARAAVALASEMTRGQPLSIEIAAGLNEETYGTDAVAIMEAVVAADSGDGVVVLMDLGSAVLSAETALELLDDPGRVTLCPAPLVEGLVAAAVAAAGGAGRDEVVAEALGGLAGKQAHFDGFVADGGDVDAGPSSFVTVTDPHGLHARPAAQVVGAARSFDARVSLRNATTGSGWVPASSLSRVATLGALQGHELEVRASGRQGQEAVDRLVAVVGSGQSSALDGVPSELSTELRLSTGVSAPAAFSEQNVSGGGPPGRAGSAVGGAASPGVAIGPAMRLREPSVEVPDQPSLGVDVERGRLEAALDETRREIARIPDPIFDAHLLLLDDLQPDAAAGIEQGLAAPKAWQAAVDGIASSFDALPDPYLRGRAADVRAVGHQVLRALLGAPAAAVTGDGVLVAADLTPAEAAGLDPARIAGVLLAEGSPTSHAAILTRTRGIPAVVGAGRSVMQIPDGRVVALDGSSGEVVVGPSEEVLASFRARAAREEGRRQGARSRAADPAVTSDGTQVLVGANIGSIDDARAAAANGADLAGLVRTEFLFLDRATAPDVDEQVAVYRAIAEALGGRRVTLRTLDAGSDKPLPYLPGPVEANPYLGVRGLRLSLTHPAVFAEQLLAIARVARETPVSVMFPMVTTVDELRRARGMLDEAVNRAGGGRPDGLRVGLMVEVPAVALRAAEFVPYADFFSVGTNDLTQYTLAAERGNPALMSLARGLDPAVARLIDELGRAAAGRVPVAVCGEVAADEQAVPRLLAAGVRQLSVAPALVPLVKQSVRSVGVDQ
ncbi:phosphoenolpyruvate--protein phosphotransferase [Actinoplanes sp. NPDC049596]|uniref:phosphoenolpyruvate--protein phosphotransferase n=1 Tax=unclassified Actinoplanes TaxID=2626549 RepID=UPI00342F1CD7